MKGRQIKYSGAEESFLADNRTMVRKELTKLFNKKFNRSVSVQNIKAKCLRMGLKTGRDGRFLKGCEPWSKGTKGICGLHPNSRKTQFKKGQEPHNTKHLGHERICSKDGYILISVDQKNPHTGYDRHYVHKHRYIWEQANGPIPKGHCLRFIDGDKTNVCLENLELVTRYENMVRNKLDYNNSPEELKPTIKTIATLRAVASAKSKGLKESQ